MEWEEKSTKEPLDEAVEEDKSVEELAASEAAAAEVDEGGQLSADPTSMAVHVDQVVFVYR